MLQPPYLDVQLDPASHPKRPFMLLRDHRFMNENLGIDVTVPAGTRVDLTSHYWALGRMLLWSWVLIYFFPWLDRYLLAIATFALILRDPYGICQIASIFHDWAYRNGKPKRWADSLYLAVMTYVEVQVWRRMLLYYGVAIFGWPSWWGHQRRINKESLDVG